MKNLAKQIYDLLTEDQKKEVELLGRFCDYLYKSRKRHGRIPQIQSLESQYKEEGLIYYREFASVLEKKNLLHSKDPHHFWWIGPAPTPEMIIEIYQSSQKQSHMWIKFELE